VYLFAWSSSQALVSSVIAAVWSDAILNYQFTSRKVKDGPYQCCGFMKFWY
jgi:hypothetical protein